jgi:hypothetical protein
MIPHQKAFCISIVLLIFFQKSFAQHDMYAMTHTKLPITAKSNESNKRQLALAKAEGDSVSNCLKWLVSKTPEGSGQFDAGEYKITYVISKPEGWYELSNNNLNWSNPLPTSNAHFWLFVQEAADGRVVPPLDIKYKIINDKGNTTDENNLAYCWVPLVNGYGDNVKLSGTGNYKIEIEIAPPVYKTHVSYNGDRLPKTQMP